jgi:hypothetical protein
MIAQRVQAFLPRFRVCGLASCRACPAAPRRIGRVIASDLYPFALLYAGGVTSTTQRGRDRDGKLFVLSERDSRA